MRQSIVPALYTVQQALLRTLPHWTIPSVPGDFTGTTADNRHDSTGTIEGPLPKYFTTLFVVYLSRPWDCSIFFLFHPVEITTYSTLWFKHTYVRDKGTTANQWLIVLDYLRLRVRVRVSYSRIVHSELQTTVSNKW